MNTHEHHMAEAISLALEAEGNTSPNPLVGCVVVKDNVVVGRGYHKAAGHRHAEAAALIDAGNKAKGATLYVSLEPCNHFGKTPPCANGIIDAGISEVFYAVSDPNPVAGGGATTLKAAGIKVVHGVLEQEATELNRFYFHHLTYGQPWVIAKFASSLDGKIASRTGHSQWITGEQARARSHQLRQSVDAILIGANTAIEDDPKLTVRLNNSDTGNVTVSHPLRVVLDSVGRVPLTSQLFSGDLPGQTIVFATERFPLERREALNARHIDVQIVEPGSDNKGAGHEGTSDKSLDPVGVNLTQVLAALGKMRIQSLMIEGGQQVLGSFMDQQLVHEVWCFMAPMIIGNQSALSAIGGNGIDNVNHAPRLTHLHYESLGTDLLIRGRYHRQENH